MFSVPEGDASGLFTLMSTTLGSIDAVHKPSISNRRPIEYRFAPDLFDLTLENDTDPIETSYAFAHEAKCHLGILLDRFEISSRDL